MNKMTGRNRVTTRLEWIIPCAALGKPRMTRRDKWKGRPCVETFRGFKDFVRLAMDHTWPEAADVHLLVIEARYVPPRSWRKIKRAASLGTLKRTAPDPDNIVKGLMDIWWGQDQAVGDVLVRRRWWDADQIIIRMHLDEQILLETARF